MAPLVPVNPSAPPSRVAVALRATYLAAGLLLGVAASACGDEDICADGDCICPAGESCSGTCSAGSCNQQCNGDCSYSCAGGGCNQQCSAGASCEFTCEGGGCIQQCSSPTGTCDFACTGICTRSCAGNPTCTPLSPFPL